MSGEIDFRELTDLSKEEKYRAVLPQISSLIKGEENKTANLANIVSVLKYTFDYYLWAGFYLTDEQRKDELVLGPFQGKVACTRLKFGNGVCGTAAERKETIVVEDVNLFPGHIFCDTESKSEIVVPVIKKGRTAAVLDIDSGISGAFDDTDKKYLEELIKKTEYLF
ncbi:MAG: GAF domain-containing protein [Ignavibacteriae bacterium]|nr:GAF domain-containing protein [Ignavibacteriota bacterium]